MVRRIIMIEINKDNFENEVLKSDKPVLLDFWASWCGPCRMQSRILEESQEALSGAKICKCNVDENPDLASQFGVQSIPTLIVFKDGQPSDRAVGVRNAAELKRMLGL